MKILVTGAANGIGAAIASRFAADAQRLGHKAQLLLVDVDASGLALLAAQLRKTGSEVELLAGDLSLADTPAQAVAIAQRAFGGLDVLVSNAGISIKMNLQDYSVEQFDKVFAVNLRATWLLGKAAQPLLAASKGCIVATASVSGAHPTPKSGPYAATKAALIMLVRQMALEWGPDGIRANSVSPGSVRTSLSPERYATHELREFARSTNPLHILIEPEEVADAVAFLVGNKAISGADIVVDAGRTLTTLNAAGLTARTGSAP
jgi:NAD(P)-dependent dehydrogenase (short-subunit alcohol dehydrogenase family)